MVPAQSKGDNLNSWTLALAVAAASSLLMSGAHAADPAIVDCADTPGHRDCSKTQRFPVEDEERGAEAFEKLKAQVYDAADPVAQVLAYSKWGDPGGYEGSYAEKSFIYPLDKANCVYAQADRVFYYDEDGPMEGGTNEVTARAVVWYLNNVVPGSLSFTNGVMAGTERLAPRIDGAAPERMAKEWAAVFARHCKGR